MVRMAEVMAAGTPVGICRMRTSSAAAFTAPGQTDAEDAQWCTIYDQFAVGIATRLGRDGRPSYQVICELLLDHASGGGIQFEHLLGWLGGCGC